MDNLPDEIAIMIFKNLEVKELLVCAVVCREWHRLICDESLWKIPSFNFKPIPMRTLAKVIQRGVHQLHLSHSAISEPLSWSRVFSPPTYRSQVQALILSDATISGECLRCLLKRMDQLRLLNVSGLDLTQCCADIAKNTNLIFLDMSKCTGSKIRNHGFEMIIKQCQKLQYLILSHMRLNKQKLATLSCHLPISVKHLSLHSCSPLMTDEHVKSILKLCPYITYLNLSFNRSLTYEALKAAYSLNDLGKLLFYQ